MLEKRVQIAGLFSDRVLMWTWALPQYPLRVDTAFTVCVCAVCTFVTYFCFSKTLSVLGILIKNFTQ